jgi:tRNA nucleotidyltransferase (CCA-adding enzyme)
MELNLPIDTRDLPEPTYCVGGWVRDAILGRTRQKLDIDFVLPEEPIGVAKKVATKYGGSFVLLDREREIARVVLPQGNLDFAKQVGDSLKADLDRRDFCMNAIALSVHDPNEIIDPHDGRGDIARAMVRMICPENIQADPLRILRAYRQAAQLGFTIETWTRQTIRQLAPLLPGVAIERIRMELGYLLHCPSSYLIECLQDGILASWLNPDRLKLARFQQVDPVIRTLTATYPALATYFQRELTLTALKYSALVPQAAMLDFLALSRLEQKWITTLLRYLPHLPEAEASDLKQYYIYDRVGEMLPALIALALSDRMPVQLTWLDRWLDPTDILAHPPTLVTGDDLQQYLKIKPSPKLGQLLIAIREAQIQRQITDREEALAFAQSWWRNRANDC